MNKRTLAIVILIPFLALTIYSVAKVGYFGLFEYHLHSPARWQVFTDLVIALLLVLMWLVPQAKTEGRNPWPWVVATLFLGSIGPLAYLAWRSKPFKPLP
ncbi:MAG: drug/metabolite transporter (DMT)-like permease [Bacteroidia bacterium]|jgi:drug/metabolite transporter (DMT)-like permease